MDESQPQPNSYTPIQSRRFRTPLPCWSLCPSMDLIACGHGSVDTQSGGVSGGMGGGLRNVEGMSGGISGVNNGGSVQAAESVTVYRIVSWQRLLTSKELSCHELDDDLGELDNLMEDGDSAIANVASTKANGATCLTWSPDGRCIAIGLRDGGVFIHSVEALEEKSEGEENQRPLHVIRPFHFTNAQSSVASKTIEEQKPKQNEGQSYYERKKMYSPRVTRSMAARRERTTFRQEKLPQEKLPVDETHKPPETPKSPAGETKSCKPCTAIVGLTWKRTSPYHSSWPLSPSEWERRETWRYSCQLVQRGSKFLPPESTSSGNGASNRSNASNGSNGSDASNGLNVLCVATQNSLCWYLQSRYRILSTELGFGNRGSISKVDMVMSPDLSVVLCVAEYNYSSSAMANGDNNSSVGSGNNSSVGSNSNNCSAKATKGDNNLFSSQVKVFSCPLLSTKRFDLQILSTSYQSIFSRLKQINFGIQSALTSWVSALRPLDTKFTRLFQLFKSYNIVPLENANESSSTQHSVIREELLRFILSGRSTIVGPASNAFDQFFTRADMHDQLLLREASGIKATLGSMESHLRSGVHSQIRAVVYETEELYGLIKAQEVTASEFILVEAQMALKMYVSMRNLYLSFEKFVAQVVEGRGRVNDFLAWMRGMATEIRARGTAADSILRQHARDRRCAHGVVCRVTDFLSAPLVSPFSVTEGKLDHRKLTECIIGIPLSDNLAAISSSPKAEISSDGERTLNSTLLQTFKVTAALFDQPRTVFSQSLNAQDLVFDVPHSQIALHTRIGVGCDDSLGDGYFSPQIHGDVTPLHCPYWVIVARTISLSNSANTLEITAIPSHVLDASQATTGGRQVCLQAHLRLDDQCEVIRVAFYGDDGNSSLSPNLDIDAESKEGRQSLGLIVKNGVQEELWTFQYDTIVFGVCDVRMANERISLPSSKSEDNFPTLSSTEDDASLLNLKKRVICTRDNNSPNQRSQLGLCGSRGTGGVLTYGPTNSLEIFDLEEDEDGDDDSDVVVDDVD